jgi:hypothetical protein
MRKGVFGSFVLLTAAMLLVPATALAGDAEITWHAGLNTRLDVVENFTDVEDNNRDTAEHVFYRANVGMGIDVNSVSAYFEIQNHGTWGDSILASNLQDPLAGNLGLTGAFQNNDMELYQGWFNLDHVGGTPISLKIGRQEKTLGNELHLGDADFYSGQFYDGINANFDFESWVLDAFWFTMAERDVLPGAILDADGCHRQFRHHGRRRSRAVHPVQAAGRRGEPSLPEVLRVHHRRAVPASAGARQPIRLGHRGGDADR